MRRRRAEFVEKPAGTRAMFTGRGFGPAFRQQIKQFWDLFSGFMQKQADFMCLFNFWQPVLRIIR